MNRLKTLLKGRENFNRQEVIDLLEVAFIKGAALNVKYLQKFQKQFTEDLKNLNSELDELNKMLDKKFKKWENDSN